MKQYTWILTMVSLLSIYFPRFRRAERYTNFNSLTGEEIAAVVELRDLLKYSEFYSNNMEDDVYLAKWLSENDFCTEKAYGKLKNHIEWREEYAIDYIQDEDWEGMYKYFPYSLEYTDIYGAPVIYINFGDWDVYKYGVKENAMGTFKRYFIKIMEEANVMVQQTRAQGYKNVAQSRLIINFEGYSTEKHGTLQCMYAYKDLIDILHANYPGATKDNTFVNVPSTFQTMYNFLPGRFQECVNIYGEDTEEWEPVLYKYLGRDQMPSDLVSYKKSC